MFLVISISGEDYGSWMVVKRNQKKKGQGKSNQVKKSPNDSNVLVKEIKKPIVEGSRSDVKVNSEKLKEAAKVTFNKSKETIKMSAEKPLEILKLETLATKCQTQDSKKLAEPSKDNPSSVSSNQRTKDLDIKESDVILIDLNKKVQTPTKHSVDFKNQKKNNKGKETKIFQNPSKKKKLKDKSESTKAAILASSSSLCEPHSSFKDQLMVSQEVEDKM